MNNFASSWAPETVEQRSFATGQADSLTLYGCDTGTFADAEPYFPYVPTGSFATGQRGLWLEL